LVPSLLGQPPANDNIIYNFFPVASASTGNFPAVWVRRDDMKLIRFFHGNGGQNNHRYELYDISQDPGEQNNLAADNPALVAELDALIEQHLTDMDAQIPIANPNYIPPVFD
ncbi:MAG: N-acetylgalactosamine 6-sulfate sulfatase (GALNS), partial [Opitutales bacterium]